MAVKATKSFILNTTSPTLLSAARSNPDARTYVLIQNLDKSNAIAWAHGTGNGAAVGHHQVSPGGFYEFSMKTPLGGVLPEASWGMPGDISAIAVTGNPQICFTEV
jgi:hypothetical protein